MYIDPETTKWKCQVCGESGNAQTFWYKVAGVNAQNLKGVPLRSLAKDRGLSTATLKRWGVGVNGNGQYTIPIPSLGSRHALSDLKRYTIGGKVVGTTGGRIGLLGCQHLRSKGVVYFCEGEWDAMALDEIIRAVGGRCSVLSGSGGASAFRSEWVSPLQGRDVVIVYDNDKAGESGREKVLKTLTGVASSIRWVIWPQDWPEGGDIRDLYRLSEYRPKEAWKVLQDITTGVPQDAQDGVSTPEGGIEPLSVEMGSGVPWETLVGGYRRWLTLSDTDSLAVIFGTLLANRLPGDPLWMFLVSPPGGTKSELLMSLGTSPMTYSLTSLTSHTLISGAQKVGGGDPSLLPKLNNRVLIIKDFTAILTMPVAIRDDILGQLRDAYDGKSEKVFGTGLRRAYRSKFGIIAGVTPAIDQYVSQNSMLGERFLKFRVHIPGKIATGGEMIKRALQNVTKETSMREDLCEIAQRGTDYAIDVAAIPVVTSVRQKEIIALAQWTAALRGVVAHERYTREVLSKPVVEVGTRLAKQYAKLAFGIVFARHEARITDDVMRIVVSVARDTIPDRVEEIVRQIYIRTGLHKRKAIRCGARSCLECRDKKKVCVDQMTLCDWVGLPLTTVMTVVQDLEMLGIMQRTKGSEIRWRLSAPIIGLIRAAKIFDVDEKWSNGT